MPSLKGIIVSTKMGHTVVVTVPYTIRHPKYGKVMKRTTRLSAHNDIPGLSVGDTVKVVETKPYSRMVYFKVTEVTGKSKNSKIEPETNLLEKPNKGKSVEKFGTVVNKVIKKTKKQS